MFEKFKLNVALRQCITLGAVLVFFLCFIFFVNLYQMGKNIDRNLESVSKGISISGVSDTVFIVNDDYEERTDALAIFCNANGECIVNNEGIFPKEMINEILEVTNSKGSEINTKGSGRERIHNNNIAYVFENMRVGKVVYVYDYTKESDSMKTYALNLIVIGFVGMLGIILYSFRYAQESVSSIETAFGKQQELVANASHELKTPLTVISTNLSILNDESMSFTPDQKRWIEGISSQVDRMNNLITEMLELAKLDNEIEKQVYTNVEYGKMMEGIILEMEGVAFEKGVVIHTEIDDKIIINGSEKALEKLAYILIDNAIKYANENGNVYVKLNQDKKKVKFSVKNTGEGISADVLPKLFERFYRADESHNSTNSFGLGLSIAKSIVDAHHGEITATSVVKEYAKFNVVFNK